MNKREPARGVREHAPPGKFGFSFLNLVPWEKRPGDEVVRFFQVAENAFKIKKN